MIKAREEANVEDIVFPISQATELAQQQAQFFVDNKENTIGIGLPSIDKVVNPFFAGTLISILGRPQNAKTFMSMFILRETMRKMQKQEDKTNEACLLITTEVSVEIAAMQWMARESGIPVSKIVRGEVSIPEMKQLDDGAYKVAGLPLFLIGHSSQRDKNNRRARPNFRPEVFEDAIDHIVNDYRDPESDSPIELKLIVTDYLQKLHIPKGETQQSFFSRCVGWSKDIAMFANCAHILNVQAGRQVDEREIKIPMIGDAQWTSTVEQFSDVVFSTHMPKVYNIANMPAFDSWGLPEIDIDYSEDRVKDIIYFNLLKQKEGVGNKAWILEGEMGLLKVNEMDFNQYRY